MTNAEEMADSLDQPVWDGIQSFLDNYVEIESLDDVVIAYTPDSREPAAWVKLALNDRGFSPTMVFMAPLRDPGFRRRLSSIIPAQRLETGRCVFLLFERDTMSHNKVVKSIFSKYELDQYKVVRAINSGRDLFVTGMAAHPAELSALNTAILERCRVAKQLLIETNSGTNLNIKLDNSRFRWMSNRGIGHPGKFLVIPSGEVATFPAEISGKLVADFAINANLRFDDDVRLVDNPVTVEVKEGRLSQFRCEKIEIKSFLDKCFRRENAMNVGELGLGTNSSVKHPVRENSHLNERVCGVHLGFGQHNQTDEATGYSCDIHVDLCAKGGLVWFDDSKEPIDLTNVTPSPNAHPALINTEDVFSDDAEEDCCGILS